MAEGKSETLADILARIEAEAKPRPKPVKELPPERKARLEGDDLEALIQLKRFYGRWILIMMALQLLIVNTGFALYGWLGYDWAPPDGVVQVWLQPPSCRS
jgi:hypothetical protein